MNANKLIAVAVPLMNDEDFDFAIVRTAYSKMKKFLRDRTLPDLFFFTDDYLGLGALDAFRDMGVSVPRDVRVVSFSNSRSGLYPYGNIAHVEFDPFSDGREIARCVLEWFDKGMFGTYSGCCSYIRGASFPVV